MRSMSKKRAKVMRTRRDLNRELDITARRCELGERFRLRGIDTGCTGRATCLHERRKRSDAGSIINRANVLPACYVCNGYVESYPILAHELGLVLRPGDWEWEAMSVRNDRG